MWQYLFNLILKNKGSCQWLRREWILNHNLKKKLFFTNVLTKEIIFPAFATARYQEPIVIQPEKDIITAPCIKNVGWFCDSNSCSNHFRNNAAKTLHPPNRPLSYCDFFCKDGTQIIIVDCCAETSMFYIFLEPT